MVLLLIGRAGGVRPKPEASCGSAGRYAGDSGGAAISKVEVIESTALLY